MDMLYESCCRKGELKEYDYAEKVHVLIYGC